MSSSLFSVPSSVVFRLFFFTFFSVSSILRVFAVFSCVYWSVLFSFLLLDFSASCVFTLCVRDGCRGLCNAISRSMAFNTVDRCRRVRVLSCLVSCPLGLGLAARLDRKTGVITVSSPHPLLTYGPIARVVRKIIVEHTTLRMVVETRETSY